MTVQSLFTQIVIIVSGVGLILGFLFKWLINPIKAKTEQIDINTEDIRKMKCKTDAQDKKLDNDYKDIKKCKEEVIVINKSITDLKIDNDRRITTVDEGMKLLLEDRLAGDDEEAKKKVGDKIQEFLIKNV